MQQPQPSCRRSSHAHGSITDLLPKSGACLQQGGTAGLPPHVIDKPPDGILRRDGTEQRVSHESFRNHGPNAGHALGDAPDLPPPFRRALRGARHSTVHLRGRTLQGCIQSLRDLNQGCTPPTFISFLSSSGMPCSVLRARSG